MCVYVHMTIKKITNSIVYILVNKKIIVSIIFT